MLTITVPSREFYDEKTGTFIVVKEQTLRLEHSLISVSKWESNWKKPFMDPINPKTREETLDYIKCMNIDGNTDPIVYSCITNEIIEKINNYIDDPMSAFKKSKVEGQGGVKKSITSEDIYYWMVSGEIPFECQKWHLNRLLALITKIGEENEKAKKKQKMPKGKTASNYAALNAARRQSLGHGG